MAGRTDERRALEAVGVEIHAHPDTWTALASDVLAGLLSLPKSLPPKWFYDARGSELFEQITELDEYYLTRAESALLDDVGAAIVDEVRPTELVELGSGSSAKTPLLLDPMTDSGRLERYVPVDVSASAIEGAVEALAERYPGLRISAEIADFTQELVPLGEGGGPRLFLLLGSTLGNFQPVEVRALLERLRPLLRPQDALLVGTDLVKDPAVLEAAYNDAAGVTEAFNRNVLTVVNRELAADFDPARFDYDSRYNPALQRVESRLRAREAHVVTLRALGTEVTFVEGESILTEISRKFTRESVTRAYEGAGLRLRAWHQDAAGTYAVSLASLA